MSLLTNLVSYWNLSESSGTRADSVGSNNLTDNNTVTGGTLGGVAASDFELDNSEYLSKSSNSGLQRGGKDWTFAAWVRLESYPGVLATIAAKGFPGTSGGEFHLFFSGSDFDFKFDIGASGERMAYAGTQSTATDYLVVCGYDDTNNQMFMSVNGAAKTTHSFSTAITSGTEDFDIGRLTGQSFYWDGLIGPCGLWDRVLDDAELDQLYNSGTPLQYADLNAPLVVAYPTFDSADDTTINLTSGGITGGVPTYSRQWQEATAANGTWSDITSETSSTLAYTNISGTTTKWIREKVTDSAGSPNVSYSPPIPVRLFGVPLVFGIIGDSTSDPGFSSNSDWPPDFATKLSGLPLYRTVTIGSSCNRAASGTHTGDWTPSSGSHATYYDPAVTAFNSGDITDCIIWLGHNDATNSGVGSISASTVAANIADIITGLKADVATLERIWLIAPLYASNDYETLYPGGVGADIHQAFYDYQSAIAALDNGNDVRFVNVGAFFHFAWNPSQQSDGEHENATGKAFISGATATGIFHILNETGGGGGGGGGGMRGGFCN